MKIRISSIIAFTILISLVSSGMILSYKDHSVDEYPDDTTQIRLYGEYHGIESYYDTEYDLWVGYYSEGYRNLFIELPYYTAEFLNDWMHEDDDAIIDAVFEDLQGSAAGNEYYYQFFQDIKRNCPETVFYGTEIGFECDTTGLRYLSYLEENGQKDSLKYDKAIECMRQGVEYFSDETVYEGLSLKRENYLVKNFIETYDSVGGKVMGIYGSDHTRPDQPLYLYCQLKDHYGDNISTVRVSSIIFGENKPYRLGISATGLICLVLFIIPKLIWEKKNPVRELIKENSNKVLSLMAQYGQIAVLIVLLLFKSSDPYIKVLPEGFYFDWTIVVWTVSVILMILYEIRGIICICSKRKRRDLYSSFAGFPVAGAVLPVLAAFLLGLYSMNYILMAVSVIWGTGFTGTRIALANANK